MLQPTATSDHQVTHPFGVASAPALRDVSLADKEYTTSEAQLL